MDNPDSRLALSPASYSRGNVYPAMVFLLMIPLASFISNSFPIIGVVSLATGGNLLGNNGPYVTAAQLVLVLAIFFIFYQIGKKIDFAANYRLRAVLSFAGALIGNLPGFYLFSTASSNDKVWNLGFGYVFSLGISEPSAILGLLTAAIAAFMIPLAGLALAYFRFQQVPVSHGQGDSTEKYSSLSPFLVASFVLAALAFPVIELVQRLFIPALPPPTPPGSFFNELVPGYVGFIVYPMLFLVAFYLIGRRLQLDGSVLRRFALSVFVSAAAGLFVGFLIGAYIAGPSAVANFFGLLSLETLSVYLVADGIFVVILGLGVASLGFVRGARHQAKFQNALTLESG
jgi:hypothetical protein